MPNVFWGGDLVKTTRSIRSGKVLIPAGTYIRIDLSCQRLSADEHGCVTFPYPIANSRRKQWLRFPCDALERVEEDSDASKSGSIPLRATYQGGSFNPR
jgi:hypothetical protein